MFDEEITRAATLLVARATDLNLWVTTAESCTGGLIAGALTSVAGASNCVSAGFVTYSNQAKRIALSVDQENLDDSGAVSEAVAQEMALGALKVAHADLALAVTGIAGPGGGTADKPVGLVYIAVAGGTDVNFLSVEKYLFGDIGRSLVRRETVLAALSLGMKALNAQA